jgi:hypothetical protein
MTGSDGLVALVTGEEVAGRSRPWPARWPRPRVEIMSA